VKCELEFQSLCCKHTVQHTCQLADRVPQGEVSYCFPVLCYRICNTRYFFIPMKKKKIMILAPSSSETLNYVVWLVRSSLQQQGGGTLSFGRVVSFSCQVGESPLWITRHHWLQ